VRILAFVLVYLLVGCGPQPDSRTDAQPTPNVTMVGDTVLLELPLGRSADNGEISVSFDAVTEDSRCPRNVQCVRAGNASVHLTLESGDDAEVVVLSSALEPRRVDFAGYRIDLRDLAPYPDPEEPPARDAYVARIAIVDTR
jgi:hypothetical protein